MSIKGTCHCGAVSYEFHHTPKWATSCNCSICRRLAALWIYAMAVNLRLADPDVVSKVPVRHFDGAETWAFFDEH